MFAYPYGSKEMDGEKTKSPRWTKWLIVLAIIFIGSLAVFFWWEIKVDTLPEEKEHLKIVINKVENDNPGEESVSMVTPLVAAQAIAEKGFVAIYDTIINREKFSLFIPRHLTPELRIGIEALNDSAGVLVVQAADVRKDNGGIVGAYVDKGNLLSKGKAKAGFCAIINGKTVVGVAESTPYLEQAIENDGYFFRQYPLVVEGQPVDNRLKYSSLRKALAELNGEIVVVMSHNRMTLNEFSRHLVDMGVKNAIYLVGSSSFGFAIDADGNRIEFGKEEENAPQNTNYIIWK